MTKMFRHNSECGAKIALPKKEKNIPIMTRTIKLIVFITVEFCLNFISRLSKKRVNIRQILVVSGY